MSYDPADVFALLDDEYARSILAAVSEDPMTAKELSKRCNVSLSTVYRRTEKLERCNLIDTRREYDKQGDHRRIFTARLQQLSIELSDGRYDLTLSTKTGSREFTDPWKK